MGQILYNYDFISSCCASTTGSFLIKEGSITKVNSTVDATGSFTFGTTGSQVISASLTKTDPSTCSAYPEAKLIVKEQVSGSGSYNIVWTGSCVTKNCGVSYNFTPVSSSNYHISGTVKCLSSNPTSSTLSFNAYSVGKFNFNLSNAVFGNVTITSTKVGGWGGFAGCTGVSSSSDTLSGSATIPASFTSIQKSGSTPMGCTVKYYRMVNAIQVSGSSPSGNLTNGSNFTLPSVPGTTFTVLINVPTCSTYAC